ncbi:glycosyltransferase family 39 protein [bacterium]|nr:glycosyltransferase family 39 protein [candidate division CSSED10-310 bacterium]
MTKRFTIIIILTLMCLPFLNKPIHMDGGGILLLARVMMDHPWRPYDGYNIFFGHRLPFSSNTHPPLFMYYLMLILCIDPGEHLPVLGLAGFLPAILCALGIYQLARRFTSHPWLASLCAIATPVFLTTTQSLHSDVFATMFLVWSAVFFLSDTTGGSTTSAWAASFCLGMSVMVAYQAIFIAPALVLHELLTTRRLRRSFILAVCPLLFMIIWGAHLHLAYDTSLFRPVQDLYASLRHNPYANLTAVTSFIGGAGPWPLFLLWGIIMAPRRPWRTLAGTALTIAAWRQFCPEYGWFHTLLFLSMAWPGFLLLLAALTNVLRGFSSLASRQSQPKIDDMMLGTWFLALSLPFAILTPFIIARYCMPALPAAVLIAVREFRPLPGANRHRLGIAAAAAAILVSLLVANADYQLARVNPQVKDRIEVEWGVDDPMFIGEFGLRHYMLRAGAEYFTRDMPDPPPGTMVATSHYIGNGLPDLVRPDLMARFRPVGFVRFPAELPIRSFNADVHAGFYCHYSGFLPWSAGWAPLEEIMLHQLLPETKHDITRREDEDDIEEETRVEIGDGWRLLLLRRKVTIATPVDGLASTVRLHGRWRDHEARLPWPPEITAGHYEETMQIALPGDLPPGRYAHSLHLVEGDTVLHSVTGNVDVPALLLRGGLNDHIVDTFPGGTERYMGFTGVFGPADRTVNPFSSPRSISRVELFSHLGDALAVRQGAEVCRVVLDRADKPSIEMPVRAGLETAEWAADNPAVRQWLSHRRARVGYTFDIGDPSYRGNIYRIVWNLDERPAVTGLRVEQGDADCQLSIDGLLLFLAK